MTIRHILIHRKKNPKFEEELGTELIGQINELENWLQSHFNFNIELEERGKAKVTMSGEFTEKIKSDFESYELNKNQVNILYQSSLISLATFFELMVASLVKKRLLDYPDSVKMEEKSLTIEEIRN